MERPCAVERGYQMVACRRHARRSSARGPPSVVELTLAPAAIKHSPQAGISYKPRIRTAMDFPAAKFFHPLMIQFALFLSTGRLYKTTSNARLQLSSPILHTIRTCKLHK